MNISRYLLFLICFLATYCLPAQGFFKTYQPASSVATDVVQAGNGDYFLVGHASNDSLLLLQRVNGNGQLVWANNFNANGSRGIAVAASADGGFVALAEYYYSPGNYKNVAIKLSATGTVEWTQLLVNPHLPNGLRDIVPTADGGFLLAGDTRDAGLNFQNWLVKLNADGSIAWQKTYGTFFLQTTQIIALSDGNFAIGGGHNGGDFAMAKVSASGDLIWQKNYSKPLEQKAVDIIAANDGGFVMLGTTQNPAQAQLQIALLKTDADGTEQWYNALYPYASNQPLVLGLFNSFVQDNAGNFYVPLWDGFTTSELLKLNSTGNALWKRSMSGSGYSWKIIHTNDSYFAIAGESNNYAMLEKLDSEGELYSNKIRGTVYRDENANCIQDGGETGWADFIVEAHSQTGASFFKKTNADGTYELRVADGDYALIGKVAVGSAEFYAVCDTPHVSIVGTSQLFENQDIGIETIAECPLLEVDVSQGFLRRCMITDYNVSYCNYGNLTAENVSVQLTVDTVLTYVNSSVPLVSQNANVYTFNVADVAPGECAILHVYFAVNCFANLGDVICAEAHIFPDTSCLPPSGAWDGSEVEITGECDNTELKFKIRNKSAAPMSQSLDYVIIEDHIMYLQGQIQLGGNQDSIIVIPNPNGACYFGKLFNNPNQTSVVNRSSAVVENCIAGGNLNLALELGMDENQRAISTTCGTVVGSFDPNDKTGFPLGWTNDHIIETDQELEYMIRFQNTGNDTAFLVVVRDTLPVATLDPATLRPVAASHNYTWDVTSTGIAVFTFPNILLPDSTTNEAASHGFIRFRIHQQPDLAEGTRIENNAAIYFDFNAPVITNTYFHTIGHFLVSATNSPAAQLLDFQVIPNPFSSEADFILKNFTPKNEMTFRLFDALGNVVTEERFEGNAYHFAHKNLAAGLYFFQMEENGVLLTTGKVVVSQ